MQNIPGEFVPYAQIIGRKNAIKCSINGVTPNVHLKVKGEIMSYLSLFVLRISCVILSAALPVPACLLKIIKTVFRMMFNNST